MYTHLKKEIVCSYTLSQSQDCYNNVVSRVLTNLMCMIGRERPMVLKAYLKVKHYVVRWAILTT